MTKLAVAAWPALVLAALPATGAMARTALPAPGPDFRHACSAAPAPGWAECLALERTNVVSYAGLARSPAGYGPAALQSAYSLTQASAAAGQGETVAVVDAYNDPRAASDLAVYRSRYHLPPCTASGCLRVVNQDGAASPLPRAAGTSGWDQEESLDLDMVSAICPNCRIILVEANNAAAANLGAAVNAAVRAGARFVSNSYSAPETAGELAADAAYYDHPGVAVTAASGDSGYGVVYPAASRYVTAVGGTSLVRSPRTARGWSETVWNQSGATGSGCSAFEAKPAWQADPGCSHRTANDVAADANPNTGVAVYDTYGGNRGWEVFGGTSVASPIIAATYALAGGPAAGASAARYPYEHASRLYDVTSGGDGSCGGAYLCTATAGYDGPTGWGTPDGTGAFAAVDNAVTVVSPGTRHSTTGEPVPPVRIAARDSDAAQTLRFTARGLPPGLSISADGAISGTPEARGYYRVQVYATDGTGMAASTSFAWTVTSVGAITSRMPGQCLDDYHGGTAARNKIDIYRCNHGRAQLWSVRTRADATMEIRLARAPGRRCVTAPGRRAAAGTRIVLERCGSSGQAWRARRGGDLVDPRSGLCLADPGAGPGGTQLVVTRCADTRSEHWNLP